MNKTGLEYTVLKAFCFFSVEKCKLTKCNKRFSAGSGGQADVDKRRGVIYVKLGYCKSERENHPGGLGSQWASGPARRGQGGRAVCPSWRDSNCPGSDRTPGAQGASIHLHPVSDAPPDRAGGPAWTSASNNENNCLPAWHRPPPLLRVRCPSHFSSLLVPQPWRWGSGERSAPDPVALSSESSEVRVPQERSKPRPPLPSALPLPATNLPLFPPAQ